VTCGNGNINRPRKIFAARLAIAPQSGYRIQAGNEQAVGRPQAAGWAELAVLPPIISERFAARACWWERAVRSPRSESILDDANPVG
jgi:hypothetical protein